MFVMMRLIMMWSIMVRRIVMRRVVMRRVVVRSAMLFAVMLFAVMLFAVMHFAAMRPAVAIIVAVEIMAMLSLIGGPSVVAASAIVMETILAPAVGVAPAGPGTHAQEETVVEVPRPVKALGRAFVGWSFVVAPLADGWFADFNGWNADLNGNLRANSWRQSQARKQCCRAE